MAAPKTDAEMLKNLSGESSLPAATPDVVPLPKRLRDIDPSGCDDWQSRQREAFEVWAKKLTSVIPTSA